MYDDDLYPIKSIHILLWSVVLCLVICFIVHFDNKGGGHICLKTFTVPEVSSVTSNIILTTVDAKQLYVYCTQSAEKEI